MSPLPAEHDELAVLRSQVAELVVGHRELLRRVDELTKEREGTGERLRVISEMGQTSKRFVALMEDIARGVSWEAAGLEIHALVGGARLCEDIIGAALSRQERLTRKSIDDGGALP